MKSMTLNIRLFIDHAWQEDKLIALGQDQAHYLIHVMRCVQGDTLRVFHQDKGEWSAILETVTKNRTTLRVMHLVRDIPSQPLPLCHLVCPPLRQNRLDMLLEKACELGLTRFTPLITDHTQVRQVAPDRLRKIVRESAEQSERLSVPHIDDPQTLKTFLSADHAQPIYVAWERHQQGLSVWQAVQAPNAGLWLIGPEGGWSLQEQECFLAHPQVRPVSLGSAILRSETAALMALSVQSGWQQRHVLS